MVSLGQKLKIHKHAKNHSTRALELFYAKNSSKKHQIFEKLEDFENRPSWSGYSPFKGYIAFAKWTVWVKNWKCQKRDKKHFTRILDLSCEKKPLKKKLNIREFRQFSKSPIMLGYSPRKGYTLCNMVSLGQKLKMRNHFTWTLELFCAKDPSKKHQLFEKWDDL